MKRILILLFAVLSIPAAHAQLNMQFRSQLTFGINNELANIGGFVDTLGNEYALVGMQTGLAIVDVTNPAAPVQKFMVNGTNSFWREVKVSGRYAYVTTEGCCLGLQIIDLRNLPASINSKYWTGTGAVAGLVTRLHSLHIDNGYAYLNGSQINGGACLITSLSDPWNPVYISNTVLSFSGNLRYMHDCFVRNDTLWGAHIYGGFFSVINVANKSVPVLLATQTTPNVFTHNVWLNTSGTRTLFTTDEVNSSFMASYDVSNLGNITLLDKIKLKQDTNAIVHNTHIRNNYAIVSWYKAGVAIVDVARPDNLIVTGFYDTYPSGSGGGFNGCWGVYPFLPSGTIVASDINNGLFVLTPTYVRGCYLEGMVRNACSNAAIPNVTVTINTVNIIKQSKVTGEYRTGTAVAGTYTVTFAKSGYQTKTITMVSLSNGVLNTMNVTLTPTVAVTITGGSVTNVLCNGASTGGVNVTASGGTTPYTWLWSHGATTEDIVNRPAGIYTVTVTDAVNCKSSATYTITQPTAPSISFSATLISCQNAQDGSITATANGGTSPYTFSWTYPPSFMNNLRSYQPPTYNAMQLPPGSSTITNLGSGNYSVTVTDNNGCTFSASYTLSNPPNPCTVSLNVKLFIEGLYRSTGYMVSTIQSPQNTMIADTVSISLHNSLAPYNMEFNQQTVLDTSGNCQVTFPGSIWTDSYYIVVRHRNSLETWSKQPITFGAVNYFDFTAIPSAPLFNSTLRKQ